jgi:ferredoxin--NADP+ reductase
VGQAVDTGETSVIPCGLVVAAIGYRTAPIPGVPFDERAGRFVNTDGLIAPGLWCVGWARRGPSGTIGTNRQDGFSLVERIAATTPAGGKAGREGLDALLTARKVAIAGFEDWQKIDALEIARARAGAPREKIVALDELRSVFVG